MENRAAYPHQEFPGVRPPSPPQGDTNWICHEPKARAMQENPNPESLKYFCLWYLESWKFCLWNFDPGLWNPECSSRISGIPLTILIGDPRRGIQNPGLSWIPLHGATGQCPTQNFMQSRNPEGYFWHPTSREYFQSQISL